MSDTYESFVLPSPDLEEVYRLVTGPDTGNLWEPWGVSQISTGPTPGVVLTEKLAAILVLSTSHVPVDIVRLIGPDTGHLAEIGVRPDGARHDYVPYAVLVQRSLGI